ncbi:MAG: MarR family transcriptional regulator [Eubacteriales bacterium]|nr:MarR family transcriptional regulator [Eubacteriales bacterium]
MFSLANTSPHSTIIKLHAADHQSFLRANHLLRQYGITVQQALVLHFLSENRNNRINQKDIELYLGISNPSVTSLMKTMVGKSLVRRLPDRSDARSYLLCLTDRGQQLQDCIVQAFSQLSQELTAGLTTEERQQLHNLLDKIIQNLSSADI